MSVIVVRRSTCSERHSSCSVRLPDASTIDAVEGDVVDDELVHVAARAAARACPSSSALQRLDRAGERRRGGARGDLLERGAHGVDLGQLLGR